MLAPVSPVSLSCGVTFKEARATERSVALTIMYYDFAVTIPAGTKENNPVEQTLKLTQGIIHRVEVSFPPGCHGLAFLRLLHEGSQKWPTNPSEAFNADGYTVPIDDYFPLDTAPYSLKAIGWSPDATYDHTITVRVGILSKETLVPGAALSPLFTKLLALLGVR